MTDQLRYDKRISEAAVHVGSQSFIHDSLDDAGLPSEAFRVYSHLLCRCDEFKNAHLSYQSIGDICFSGDSNSPVTRKKKAMESVKILVERGFVEKKTNFTSSNGQGSNTYHIKSPEHWLAISTDKSE